MKKKLCPKCNAEMVVKFSESGNFQGRPFYGCSNYPECTHIITIDRRKKSKKALYLNIFVVILLGGAAYYPTAYPKQYTKEQIEKNIQLMGAGSSDQQWKALDELYTEASNSIDILHNTLALLKKATRSDHAPTKENAMDLYNDLNAEMSVLQTKKIVYKTKKSAPKAIKKRSKGFFSFLQAPEKTTVIKTAPKDEFKDINIADLDPQDFKRYDLYFSKVNFVNDGDTIKLQDGTKVRYLGVDTPEVDHSNSRKSEAGAETAFKLNRKLASGKRVIVVVPKKRELDRYKRLLAYIYAPVRVRGKNAYVNIAKLLLKRRLGDSKYGNPDYNLPLAVNPKIESLTSRNKY